jgi:putative intracellular protease/amidase
MKKKPKSGRVAILVTDGFEQVELTKPRAGTSFPSIRIDLTNAGARWADKTVVVDGILVTSRKPADIPAFNNRMLKAFGSRSGSRH